MHPDLQILPLSPPHAPALADLFLSLRAAGDDRLFHPHPLTAGEAHRLCSAPSPDYYCLAIESNHRAAAYGLLRGWSEGYAVPSLGIAVHPDARGRGVARAVMHHLHAEAARRGAPRVRLKVYPDNAPALRLYQSLGYQFPDRHADQLVGTLELSPPQRETPPMRFYGQWTPPVDQVLFERYFQGHHNGFFIEAGAFDGLIESSCKFFEESLGWRGANLEPTPWNFRLLEKNRPASLNLQLALSDARGTANFTQAVHPQRGQHFGNGSLGHTPEHLQILRGEGCSFELFPVPTITYRDFIAEHRITEVDLMVLDVEGHEPQVIAGMTDAQVLPRILCIEHGHRGVEGTTRMLAPLGYQYDFSSHNNSMYRLRAAA
jgi:FkbM family methyltransferase